ncbi:lactate racemase domain-containing protein [bacterium]|nr:lactate racemase domain-containing protein [bacterium]
MEYFYEGSPTTVITEARAAELLEGMLAKLGPLKKVLLLPPDITRHHSWAGELTVILYKMLSARGVEIRVMPAIGTHLPMTPDEIHHMFPGVPVNLFREHDWRHGLARLGEVPSSFIEEITGGKLHYGVPCEVDGLLANGGFDRIISIGQLVPHEVIGIANHNKNIYVGTGGAETINRTHFIGACCNMEKIMGRGDTPVRAVFNYMDREWGKNLPISYVLTVRGKGDDGSMVTRGLFAGDNDECFKRGAKLCTKCNIELLDKPLKKVLVRLEGESYKSTWLGNKAIYRTRMAMADDGDLIILAPGVRQFGEDTEIDRLIRKYGYHGTPATLAAVEKNPELAANLSAAAHLIHGSSEGRFRITYCPGGLTREEVEGVGFIYGELKAMEAKFKPEILKDGYNTLADGEEIFYISNPALGLWGLKSQFE